MEQLLDAAVRSVSAFGTADDMVDEDETKEPPRHTVKTAEFLKTLKREVAGDNEEIRARFERKLKPSQDLPDLTVDYAFHKWMVQVTSLPGTPRQAMHTLRESQSKLLEMDLVRRGMDRNQVAPVLLVNEDVLVNSAGGPALDEAARMLKRLDQLASSLEVEILKAPTPEVAASLLTALV